MARTRRDSSSSSDAAGSSMITTRKLPSGCVADDCFEENEDSMCINKNTVVPYPPIVVPPLPTELYALILSMSLPSPSSSSHQTRLSQLLNLSLVSTLFYSLSQKHLYSHISLTSTRRFFLRSYELQNAFNDGLRAGHVRCLKLDVRESTETQQKLFGEVAMRLVGSCKGLEELWIGGVRKFNLVEALSGLKKIKIVFITNCGIIGPRHAPSQTLTTPLKYLSISQSRFFSTSFPSSFFPNLIGLSILEPTYVRSESPSELLETVSLLIEPIVSNLQHLRFDIYLRSAIKEFFPQMTNLKSLDMISCLPTYLVQSLPTPPKLLRIYVSHHAIRTYVDLIKSKSTNLKGMEKMVVKPCGCLPAPDAYGELEKVLKERKIECELQESTYGERFWEEALAGEESGVKLYWGDECTGILN